MRWLGVYNSAWVWGETSVQSPAKGIHTDQVFHERKCSGMILGYEYNESHSDTVSYPVFLAGTTKICPQNTPSSFKRIPIYQSVWILLKCLWMPVAALWLHVCANEQHTFKYVFIYNIYYAHTLVERMSHATITDKYRTCDVGNSSISRLSVAAISFRAALIYAPSSFWITVSRMWTRSRLRRNVHTQRQYYGKGEVHVTKNTCKIARMMILHFYSSRIRAANERTLCVLLSVDENCSRHHGYLPLLLRSSQIIYHYNLYI